MKPLLKSKRFIRTAIINLLIVNLGISALALEEEAPKKSLATDKKEIINKRSISGSYILGAGDEIMIEVLYIPELSGSFPVNIDGNVYLPRLRNVYVSGLTLDELRLMLTKRYKEFVLAPELYVQIISYRPIRVYVRGEVQRPGYYTLRGAFSTTSNSNVRLRSRSSLFGRSPGTDLNNDLGVSPDFMPQGRTNPGPSGVPPFPTVFDAIRTAQGITSYSNLSKVEVIRDQPLRDGGGKIRASLDFLRLITLGDKSQNIRIFDGDVITVSRSNKILKDQIIKARNSNLSPENLTVFVSGQVHVPGGLNLPNGSGLNQALALAGGPKLLSGKVEFVRFSPQGNVERRLFTYTPKAKINSFKNPVLMPGDVIRVRDSFISATATIVREVSAPLVGGYGLYNLIGGD